MQNKKLNKKLGLLFKNDRIKAGLSQADVCERLGYSSPQFLSNFERGLCMLPMAKLKQLIEFYSMNGEAVAEMIVSIQEAYIREELNVKKKRTLKSV